jgi:uncharacterized protein (DUF2384 family)
MAAVRSTSGSRAKAQPATGTNLVRKPGAVSVARRASSGRSGTRATVVISEPGKPTRKISVDPLRVKIAIVTEALGSRARAAEYLGVSRSQPGKWLTGEESPNPRARRMIQDFDYVWGRLTDERSQEVAELWLSSPNAFLNGATPITWMRTRGAEDVVGAIDAEEAGSFA